MTALCDASDCRCLCHIFDADQEQMPEHGDPVSWITITIHPTVEDPTVNVIEAHVGGKQIVLPGEASRLLRAASDLFALRDGQIE